MDVFTAKTLEEFIDYLLPLNISLSVVNMVLEQLKANITYFRKKFPTLPEDGEARRNIIERSLLDVASKDSRLRQAAGLYRVRKSSVD